MQHTEQQRRHRIVSLVVLLAALTASMFLAAGLESAASSAPAPAAHSGPPGLLRRKRGEPAEAPRYDQEARAAPTRAAETRFPFCSKRSRAVPHASSAAPSRPARA
jgi:hypothetical protein